MNDDDPRANDLHAMVFSGGGANGAYQLGVGRALFNGKCRSTYHEPLDPDAFTGTSIGSFNAAFLVSQWQQFGAAAVGNLEKVWLDRIASVPGTPNGGFRVRFDPFDFLDPRVYLHTPLRPFFDFAADVSALAIGGFNRGYNLFASKEPVLQRFAEMLNLSGIVVVDPWERTIRDSIEFEAIRMSRKKLRIAATNWAFGEVREFVNRDMTDKLGPAAIRASSSIPGFYPPAQVGAQTYVDGAVLMNTPLRPGLRALSEVLKGRRMPQEESDQVESVLHVIYMNTEVEKMPIEALQSTLQTLYRQQIISWAAAVNRDIDNAENLNNGLEFIRSTDKELALRTGLEGDKLKTVLESAHALVEALKQGRKFKMVTIHRYFPPDGLDGALGFMDVRLPRIKRLIDEGFQNTVHHDCKANGCVLSARYQDLAER